MADKPTIGSLYFQVIKKYKLPVLNHTVIKAKIKALEAEIGYEEASLYLSLLLENDYHDIQGDYKPMLANALDIYGKRIKIMSFLDQFLAEHAIGANNPEDLQMPDLLFPTNRSETVH